jgi:hypothetical protein
MVNLEFHKPSTWSKGQKIGIVGVIALIIGPFLPYSTTEVEFGNEIFIDSYSYLNFEFWGLFMFLPFLCALMFVILLYLRIDIYVEKGSSRRNLKPILTMLLGFWFFLTYIADAIRFTEDLGFAQSYPGAGSMLIIAGFFLSGFAGFLEWRRPTTVVSDAPSQKEMKREEIAPVAPQPTVEKVPPVTPQEPPREQIVKEEPKGPVPIYPASSSAPKSYVEDYRIQSKLEKPVSKDQKTLLSWAKRLDRHKDIYEKCINCEKYGFIEVVDTGLSLVFTCPNCNERFKLKK